MNVITGLLVATIRMSTPLMLGALGEVFVERTGVMNIAIEGIFLMGAWGGFVGAYLTGKLWAGFYLPYWWEFFVEQSMVILRLN